MEKQELYDMCKSIIDLNKYKCQYMNEQKIKNMNVQKFELCN